MANDVEKKVISIIAGILNINEDKIVRESRFTEDLGTDSLYKVEIVMALETEFDCDIPDEAAGQIVTVEDVIKYIEKVQAEKAI